MRIGDYQLRKRQPDHLRGYTAPALTLLCVVGFLCSLAAIAISFFLVWLRKPNWKTTETVPEATP